MFKNTADKDTFGRKEGGGKKKTNATATGS